MLSSLQRGWVLLVCTRTTQCLNSMCKPYWISKLMILLVSGVSLTVWQCLANTIITSVLGRLTHLFFGGAITSELLLVMKLESTYTNHLDDEFDKWMVGLKNVIVCVHLTALALASNYIGGWSWEGWNISSGHGRGQLADIMPAKTSFYLCPIMRVLPKCAPWGHHRTPFLDMVEEYVVSLLMCIVFFWSHWNYLTGIPLQITTDKGSEIWEMVCMHLALRYVSKSS